jgi:hypothetical protein
MHVGISGVHERGAFVHEPKKRPSTMKKNLFVFEPDVLQERTRQTEKKLTMYRVKSLRYLCDNNERKMTAYYAICCEIRTNYYGGLPCKINE